MSVKVETLVLGNIETNCYLLSTLDTVLVIDPGFSPRRIIEKLNDEYKGQLDAVLLTHGHFDHIGAVDALVRTYHCPVYGCQDDEKLFTEPSANTLFFHSATVKSEITWLETPELKIGDINIKIHYTPGHSPGSVIFEIDGKLFAGDTVFFESVGRTDLYGGSFSQLKQSLTVLNELPYDMIIYPGHGETTTVGHELQYNPFL